MSKVKMVILANSWRPGGVCLAGKTLPCNHGSKWLRPIHSEKKPALPTELCKHSNNVFKIGDIVEFEVSKKIPDQHQTENVLLPNQPSFSYLRCASKDELKKLASGEPKDLWLNDRKSTNGLRDYIENPKEIKNKNSLRWIYAPSVTISSKDDGEFFDNPGRISVRAEFEYCGVNYKLKVKDRIVEGEFSSKAPSEKSVGPHYLCISLTLPYDDNGRAYKLVAGMAKAV